MLSSISCLGARHKLSLSSRMRSRNYKNSRRELMAPASLRLRKPYCWLPGPSAWGKIPQLQAGSCLFKFCLSVYSTTLPFKLLVSTDPLERGINNEGPSNAYLQRFSLELKTEKNYPFYSVYTSIVNSKTFVFKVVKVFLYLIIRILSRVFHHLFTQGNKLRLNIQVTELRKCVSSRSWISLYKYQDTSQKDLAILRNVRLRCPSKNAQKHRWIRTQSSI